MHSLAAIQPLAAIEKDPCATRLAPFYRLCLATRGLPGTRVMGPTKQQLFADNRRKFHLNMGPLYQISECESLLVSSALLKYGSLKLQRCRLPTFPTCSTLASPVTSQRFLLSTFPWTHLMSWPDCLPCQYSRTCFNRIVTCALVTLFSLGFLVDPTQCNMDDTQKEHGYKI